MKITGLHLEWAKHSLLQIVLTSVPVYH